MGIKDLKPGTKLKLTKLDQEDHKTTPPPLFTEPKLVAELAARDIGRPSTYSSIVSLIQDRGYVAKKGNQLYPTALGFNVARVLKAKFPQFTNYQYSAEMEKELERIAEWKMQRVQFLDTFWNHKSGFAQTVENLSKTIDIKELEQYSLIDLHNGFSIKFNKFGTFLQDNNGKPNEKGYLPSVRIDDLANAMDFKDKEVCEKTFEDYESRVEAKELGVLTEGEYKDWTVWARDGKFGKYLQASHPKRIAANEVGKKPAATVPKPINHPLPEHLDIETVELKDIQEMFAEVKMPRWSPDGKWLVGIGKKGPYIGKKSSPRGRPAFRGLPDGEDPKTVSFEKVQEFWAEAEAKKKAVAAKKKK